MSLVYQTQSPRPHHPQLPFLVPKMRSEGTLPDRKIESRAKAYLVPRENTLTCHTQLSTVASTTKDDHELTTADPPFDFTKYQKSTTLTSKIHFTTENDDPKSIVETRPKVRRMGSILKKAGSMDMHGERVDKNGTPIIKGSKKHTLTFEKKIHTVSFVENWKEFNKEKDQRIPCVKCPMF